MFKLLVCFLSLHAVRAQRTCDMDIALVIDRSGSIWVDQDDKAIGEQNWNEVTSFTANLILGLRVGADGASIALVAFEDNAELIFNLGELSQNEMFDEALNLAYDQTGGATRMDLAFNMVQNQVFTSSNIGNRDATNVVVLITDGKISRGFEGFTMQTVSELKADGTRILVLGVTDQIDVEQLEDIASFDEDVFTVDDFSDLQGVLEEIRFAACRVVTPPTGEVGSPIGPPGQTSTPGPPTPRTSECPSVDPYAVAFSAVSQHQEMMEYRIGMVIAFQRTFTNVGGAYSIQNSRFTCPCEGLYEFNLVLSYLTQGVGAVIVRNGEVVSPLAYVTPSGAMSTTTIIMCRANQQVWAEVKIVHEFALMPCTYMGMSLHGFTGKLLAVVNPPFNP